MNDFWATKNLITGKPELYIRPCTENELMFIVYCLTRFILQENGDLSRTTWTCARLENGLLQLVLKYDLGLNW